MNIDKIIALDLETTGLSPEMDNIIEVGAAKIENGVITDKIDILINPGCPISKVSTDLTGITDKDVENAPAFSEICGQLLEFIGDTPILGHNIIFDFSFLKCHFQKNGYNFQAKGIDTWKISKKFLPGLEKRTLTYLTEYFDVDAGSHHRAYDDAVSAYRIYQKMLEQYGGTEDKVFQPELLLYKPAKASPITEKQVNFLSSLMRRYNVQLDKDVRSLTKSEASKEIDKILSTYGRAE